MIKLMKFSNLALFILFVPGQILSQQLDCNFDLNTLCNWQNSVSGVEDDFDWQMGNSVAVDGFHSIPRTVTGTGSFAYAQGKLRPTESDTARAWLVSPAIDGLSRQATLTFNYWKTAAPPVLQICTRDAGVSELRCLDTVSGLGSQQWIRREVTIPPNPLPFQIIFVATNFRTALDLIGLDDVQFRINTTISQVTLLDDPLSKTLSFSKLEQRRTRNNDSNSNYSTDGGIIGRESNRRLKNGTQDEVESHEINNSWETIQGTSQQRPTSQGPSQRGLSQLGPSQEVPQQVLPQQKPPNQGSSQRGPTQPGPSQQGPSQQGPSQQGPSQQGPSQQGLSQQGPSQQGPSQQGPSQQGLSQQGPSQQGPSQQGPSQQGLSQPGPSQPQEEQQQLESQQRDRLLLQQKQQLQLPQQQGNSNLPPAPPAFVPEFDRGPGPERQFPPGPNQQFLAPSVQLQPAPGQQFIPPQFQIPARREFPPPEGNFFGPPIPSSLIERSEPNIDGPIGNSPQGPQNIPQGFPQVQQNFPQIPQGFPQSPQLIPQGSPNFPHGPQDIPQGPSKFTLPPNWFKSPTRVDHENEPRGVPVEAQDAATVSSDQEHHHHDHEPVFGICQAVACPFDTSLCNWYNDVNANFDWKLKNNQSQYQGIPQDFSARPSYVFVTGDQRRPDHRAVIKSQALVAPSGAYLELFSFVTDPTITRLSAYMNVGVDHPNVLWQTLGNGQVDKNTWQRVRIPLPASSFPFTLSLVADQLSTGQYIGVDDLRLVDSSGNDVGCAADTTFTSLGSTKLLLLTPFPPKDTEDTSGTNWQISPLKASVLLNNPTQQQFIPRQFPQTLTPLLPSSSTPNPVSVQTLGPNRQEAIVQQRRIGVIETQGSFGAELGDSQFRPQSQNANSFNKQQIGAQVDADTNGQRRGLLQSFVRQSPQLNVFQAAKTDQLPREFIYATQLQTTQTSPIIHDLTLSIFTPSTTSGPGHAIEPVFPPGDSPEINDQDSFHRRRGGLRNAAQKGPIHRFRVEPVPTDEKISKSNEKIEILNGEEEETTTSNTRNSSKYTTTSNPDPLGVQDFVSSLTRDLQVLAGGNAGSYTWHQSGLPLSNFNYANSLNQSGNSAWLQSVLGRK